jgi:hypothetical protein
MPNFDDDFPLSPPPHAQRPPPTTTPDLPPGAKTIEQLLAEVNALSHPADITEWWRSNYPLIKAAQRRAAYTAPARGQFLLPLRKRKVNTTPMRMRTTQ